jgi:HipA-like protein
MTALMVLINGGLAGRVFADRHGKPRFAYYSEWKNSRDAIPLSLSLPLVASDHATETVAAKTEDGNEGRQPLPLARHQPEGLAEAR